MIWVAPYTAAGYINTYDTVMEYLTPLQAIQHAQQTFGIDPDRVYVCGHSGGAGLASMIAQMYPDLVNGGYFSGSMDFYKSVGGAKRGGRTGFWPNGPRALIDLDRQSSRFVLQAIGKDSARWMQQVRDAMIEDGFQHVTYLEAADNAGSSTLDAEWFDKGIVALDAPLASAAQQKYKDAQAAEKKHLIGDALILYRAAAAHGRDQPFAADAQAKSDLLNQQYNDDLNQIQSLIADKKFTEAIDATHKLQARWGTLATDKGRDLLVQIGKARTAKPG